MPPACGCSPAGWSSRFPLIVAAVAALKVRSYLIDGEAVAYDDNGRENWTKTKSVAEMTQDIEIFANHCVFMRSIYLHARELFETSSAEDKALMGMTAGTFFGDLNRVLNEYVILQVCKITDPAHDNRNNDNHTIAFLLEHYDLSSDPPILKRLKDLHASMQAFRQKILPARHKLISHSDRAAILAGRPLGAASDKEWNQFWLDLEKFICIVHRKVIG
jgi:hypothetical protein